jgi:hypothetical protein
LDALMSTRQYFQHVAAMHTTDLPSLLEIQQVFAIFTP